MASTNGPAATVDDIRKDLQSLKDDVTRLAEQVSTAISASGDATLNGMKGRLNSVGEAVHDAGERGRDAVTDFAESIGSTVEETVRSRPLTTVAVALGLGVLVGALLRR
ncbi:MAG: DUF883 family protein [Rhodoplanes sp.]|uniref:DUF883 family protein n=1 Tax=Rhodoplanes sp. TaxID=1968906 RepID=UPI00181EDE50|nr:DUF883 domain-containing protein [Rhodoplanes sp.]NVO16938.1 DUF883 family protein [Rhodoplanes sp.]